nr:hypothetical protein [Pelomonas sp. KK5]
MIGAARGQRLQRVRQALLLQPVAGPGQCAAGEVDLAALGAEPDPARLLEQHAVEEGIDREALARQRDRRGQQAFAAEAAEAFAGRFQAGPEARHGDAAAGRDVGAGEARQPGQRRVHRAVHVLGPAAGRVEVHQAQHAEDRAHVRLDHRLRHGRGQHRVDGAAALAQHVGAHARDDRMRGHDHALAAAGPGLAAEGGAGGQSVDQLGRQRIHRRVSQ